VLQVSCWCRDDDGEQSDAQLAEKRPRPHGRTHESRYLVVQGLGGGQHMHQLIRTGSERFGMKLVPWTAVAVDVTATALSDHSGRAFCFLPLPVRTGLPVHVNGYFELSSNRRDVWYRPLPSHPLAIYGFAAVDASRWVDHAAAD
jgi:hypothetical protein